MDPIFATQKLAREWANLIGANNMPAELVTAIEVFTAADAVPKPDPVIAGSTITAANAEKRLTEYAATLATAQHFGEARQAVLYALSSTVRQIAYASVEQIRDDVLQPRLDAAADRFAAAIAVIGDGELSAAELVHRGGSAVDAFHEALAAQAEIDTLDRWAAGLTALMGGGVDVVCRISAPETRAQLQALENARGGKGDLNTLYVAIVNHDVRFHLNTPGEAAAVRQSASQAVTQ